MRQVRGSLFVDYVRMIRGKKGCDWRTHLAPEDMAYLDERVRPDKWYPMETFERMGNAILSEIGHGNLEMVRMWGRLSVGPMRAQYPDLVKAGDPMETMARFMIFRKTFFSYDVFHVVELTPEHAIVSIAYEMGAMAEEAATYQTMGFFEAVLETAGASEVTSTLKKRSWAEEGATRVHLDWQND